MNHDEIRNLAKAAAKNIKTEADLNEFGQTLTIIPVKSVLNDDCITSGYSSHDVSDGPNSLSGSTLKIL